MIGNQLLVQNKSMDRVGQMLLITSTAFKCVSASIQPRNILDDVYVKRLKPSVHCCASAVVSSCSRTRTGALYFEIEIHRPWLGVGVGGGHIASSDTHTVFVYLHVADGTISFISIFLGVLFQDGGTV